MIKFDLRESNGSNSEDFKNQEYNESIAVHEDATELKHDGQYGHRDRHLSECRQKPSHPVDRVVQTHHSHYL